MDYDTLFFKNTVIEEQLNKAKLIIERYEKALVEKQTEINLLGNKLEEAERDVEQVRRIMTDNITQTNEKLQDYLNEIEQWRQKYKDATSN